MNFCKLMKSSFDGNKFFLGTFPTYSSSNMRGQHTLAPLIFEFFIFLLHPSTTKTTYFILKLSISHLFSLILNSIHNFGWTTHLGRTMRHFEGQKWDIISIQIGFPLILVIYNPFTVRGKNTAQKPAMALPAIPTTYITSRSFTLPSQFYIIKLKKKKNIDIFLH